MRMNALPNVKTQTQYSRFAGGLDLVSPPLTIDAGKCISINNYECNSLGGYRRIDGYVRFDGRPSPSAQSYYYCPCTFVGAVTVGQTITGATSAATGKVLQVESTYLIIDRVTGTFVLENFNVSGVLKGALTILPSKDGHPTGIGHATALGLTADDYRTDITADRVKAQVSCNSPACHDRLQAFLKRPKAEVDKSADQDVVTRTTIYRVGAVVAHQNVISTLAHDCVMTGTTINDIRG